MSDLRHGLVLVGMRGAGKTTLGALLAAQLRWPFADTDVLLAAAVGEDAGSHLARVGEAAFRAREEQITRAALAEEGPQVLALGGGAVLSPHVRRHLLTSGHGRVLLLAPLPVLAARIAAAEVARPPLTALPRAQELELLWQQRRFFYHEVAELTVDTGATNADECCRQVLQQFGLLAR